MRKLVVGLFVLALILGGGAVEGQASKAAVKFSEMILLPEVSIPTGPDSVTPVPGAWVPINGAEPVVLKNGSGRKDFIVGVSLECGMWTDTQVKGKKGGATTAQAQSGVRVRVVLDKGMATEQIASPYYKPGDLSGAGSFGSYYLDNGIIYCGRDQELSAVLGGVLESCDFQCQLVCPIPEEDGGCVDVKDYVADCSFTKEDCEFSDEEIALAISTMNASHFNFLLTDVGGEQGGGGIEHTLTVEVAVDLGTFTDSEYNQCVADYIVANCPDDESCRGDAEAACAEDSTVNSWAAAGAGALVGRGIITVEEVRLVKDADVEF